MGTFKRADWVRVAPTNTLERTVRRQQAEIHRMRVQFAEEKRVLIANHEKWKRDTAKKYARKRRQTEAMIEAYDDDLISK